MLLMKAESTKSPKNTQQQSHTLVPMSKSISVMANHKGTLQSLNRYNFALMSNDDHHFEHKDGEQTYKLCDSVIIPTQ